MGNGRFIPSKQYRLRPSANRLCPGILFILTLSTACGDEKNEPARPDSITVQQFDSLYRSGEDIFVLDVRSQPEYKSEHLSFTDVLIPHTRIEENLGHLPEDKNSFIYCYCRSGARSGFAVRRLKELGYPNAVNVEGGIIAWKQAGFELVSEK